LNRKVSTRPSFFGSEDYSKEELVAEFGSSFLCATAGIDSVTMKNSAAYLKNWVSALRNQPKMLIEAAAQAQNDPPLII
jgi:antirestriction protein ArdC